VSRYHLFHKIVQQLASSLLIFFCSRVQLAEAGRLQSGMVAGILGSEREVEFTDRMSVSEAASGRPDEECRRTSVRAESLSPLHTVEDILCPSGTIDTTHVVCYRQTVFLCFSRSSSSVHTGHGWQSSLSQRKRITSLGWIAITTASRNAVIAQALYNPFLRKELSSFHG
jgi:hypothetical protein